MVEVGVEIVVGGAAVSAFFGVVSVGAKGSKACCKFDEGSL